MLRNSLQDKPSQQLLWLLLGVLFGFIVSVAAQLMVSGLMWAQVITQVCTFLLPGVLVAWLAGVRGGMPKWGAAGIGAIGFLLLVPCLDVITQWNKAWPLPHSALEQASEALLEGWLMRGEGLALVQNLVVVALVPAVCEECFFRLGLQRILARWWGRGEVALVVTALVFSLAHGDMFGLVPRFVMGLLLGLMYMRTGSMLVNMSAHFVNNALVVLLYWLYARGILAENIAEQGTSFAWWLTLLLTLLGTGAMAVVCRSPKFANSNPTTA